MKYITLIIIVVFLASAPAPAQAFGIFKYTWDALANQFGFDRGPIPKVVLKRHPHPNDKYGKQIPDHVYFPAFHLQADGF